MKLETKANLAATLVVISIICIDVVYAATLGWLFTLNIEFSDNTHLTLFQLAIGLMFMSLYYIVKFSTSKFNDAKESYIKHFPDQEDNHEKI